MSKPIVGYIGLGHAGYPMASCLAKKGYTLIVHDADHFPAMRFVSQYPQCKLASNHGTARDGTLAHGAFQDCSIVITMLPDGRVVRDVLVGEKGVATELKPGSVVVDMSSSSPFDTQSLGDELAKLEIDLIDSPITQKELHAIDRGGATLMIGSNSQSALEKALPVLRNMSTYVFCMGKLGTGHTMKTLNNYVSVGSIIALCDALVTGQKLGLDPQQMIDVLNCGTGVNFSTAYSMRTLKSFDTGYQLELLVKDVKIAKNVIDQSGFQTELPAMALKYLEESLPLVEKGACHSKCIQSWEQRAGVEIKKSDRKRAGLSPEL